MKNYAATTSNIKCRVGTGGRRSKCNHIIESLDSYTCKKVQPYQKVPPPEDITKDVIGEVTPTPPPHLQKRGATGEATPKAINR